MTKQEQIAAFLDKHITLPWVADFLLSLGHRLPMGAGVPLCSATASHRRRGRERATRYSRVQGAPVGNMAWNDRRKRHRSSRRVGHATLLPAGCGASGGGAPTSCDDSAARGSAGGRPFCAWRHRRGWGDSSGHCYVGLRLWTSRGVGVPNLIAVLRFRRSAGGVIGQAVRRARPCQTMSAHTHRPMTASN